MIRKICEKLEFPQEATEYLESGLHAIMKDAYLSDMFFEAMDDYFSDDGTKCDGLIVEISGRSGIHVFTIDMIFLLMCARPLRYIYKQKGLSEEIYWDTMCDMRYKLIECKKMYGIWGTFVFSWFRGFFFCERFKLGRLQYERRRFSFEDHRGILKEGDTVYNCHIPSCGPLTPESVIDSLKRAYAFFADELEDGILPICCHSWMLYPPTAELYPKGSNLRAFYDMFSILSEKPNESNSDFWRIFYKSFSPEMLDTIAPETSLQKNFLEYLKTGALMGSGNGVLLFDGEKII